MLIGSIPGYSVHKLGKDKYAVHVTNGNIGAGIIDKKHLKELSKKQGGNIKDVPVGKIALGAAAIASAVIFRKNIAKGFEKAVQFVKDFKFAELGSKIKTGASNLWTKVTEFAGKIFKKA